jgi:hypothetical protein
VGPRHADAIALGEADETRPRIVADDARGGLKEVYKPLDDFGQERKPSMQDYPRTPWQTLDLDPVQSCAISSTGGRPSLSFPLNPAAAVPMIRLKARREIERPDRRLLRRRQFRHQRKAHRRRPPPRCYCSFTPMAKSATEGSGGD